MQRLLDRDTVLLEYSLGSKRSYLWAVTPSSITTIELPEQEKLEKLARQFYQLLTDTRIAYVKQDLASVSAQLSQMLLLPAELVVLSACQTGLGQEVQGEGLVGLTRGFMYAGARRGFY